MGNEKLENELEVEIEHDPSLDAPEDDLKVEPVDDEPKVEAKVQPTIEQGLEELRAQLDREKNARLEAERSAREASEREARARNEVDDTNMRLLDGAINDVKRENAWYKDAIAKASAAGEYEKVAEYSEAMATNAAKLMRLEEGRTAMESRPKVEPMQRTGDPVEQFASQLSPRSAEWIRKNPDFVTDPRLNRKMIAAHEMALADGLKADTNEYFEYIEDTLKIRRPDPVLQQEEPLSSASAPTQRRAAPPAAPVSRQAPAQASRPNVVRLNAAEREMAQMMGMTEKEYARNKMLLIKEGKLPN